MSQKIHIRLGGQPKRHRLRDLLKQAESEPTTSHQPGETVSPTGSDTVNDQSSATPLPPIQPKPPGHAYRPPVDHEVAEVTTQRIELEGSIPLPRAATITPPPPLLRRLLFELKIYGLILLAVLVVTLAAIFMLQI